MNDNDELITRIHNLRGIARRNRDMAKYVHHKRAEALRSYAKGIEDTIEKLFPPKLTGTNPNVVIVDEYEGDPVVTSIHDEDPMVPCPAKLCGQGFCGLCGTEEQVRRSVAIQYLNRVR